MRLVVHSQFNPLKVKPELKSDLVEMVRQSFSANREMGAVLCGGEEDPILGRKCMGEACEVDIKDCRDKPVLGSFHTHPHSQPYINEGDVLAGVGADQTWMCVGGNSKAPTLALEVGKAMPAENLVVRCLRLDVNREAFEQLRRMMRRYEPKMEAQFEELKERNRRLEAEGASYRVMESPQNTPAYHELRRESRPLLEAILTASKHRAFKLED